MVYQCASIAIRQARAIFPKPLFIRRLNHHEDQTIIRCYSIPSVRRCLCHGQSFPQPLSTSRLLKTWMAINDGMMSKAEYDAGMVRMGHGMMGKDNMGHDAMMGKDSMSHGSMDK